MNRRGRLKRLLEFDPAVYGSMNAGITHPERAVITNIDNFRWCPPTDDTGVKPVPKAQSRPAGHTYCAVFDTRLPFTFSNIVCQG